MEEDEGDGLEESGEESVLSDEGDEAVPADQQPGAHVGEHKGDVDEVVGVKTEHETVKKKTEQETRKESSPPVRPRRASLARAPGAPSPSFA